jgi:hypothetical protein
MNFRTQYYSALGVKSIQIKPSLDHELSQNILDTEKLIKLCLWVRIPHDFRFVIWKVLTGVLPPLKDAWDFIQYQQLQEFKDLSHFMQSSSEFTPLDLVKMILFSNSIEPHFAESSHLLPLAAAFIDMCPSNCEAFFIFRALITKLHIPIHGEFHVEKDIQSMINLISKHEPEIYQKCTRLSVNFHHLCRFWFQSFFSTILRSENLESIWDIVIAGEYPLLCYVGLGLMISVKHRILNAETKQDIEYILSRIRDYIDSDFATNTAINIWEIPLLEKPGN